MQPALTLDQKMKRKLDERDVPIPVEHKPALIATATNFETFSLDTRILQAVAREGFSKPTSIQTKVIPLVLQGYHSTSKYRYWKDISLCFPSAAACVS